MDDFDNDDEGEFVFPGADLRHSEDQQRAAMASSSTVFNSLMAGKTTGKKVQLLARFTDTERPVSNSFVNILEIKGPDSAAMNVQVSFGPPKIIPLTPSFTLAQAQDVVDRQNASGTIDNFGVEASAIGFAYTPIIGVVDWGVGGTSFESVECDFANGTNLNLTCSFLRIRCLIDPFIELLDNTSRAGSNGVYELAAFVGPGMAKRNNAQRTIPLGNNLNPPVPGITGFTPVVPIPKFANRAWAAIGRGQGLDTAAIAGWQVQIVFMASPPTGIAPFAANPAAVQLGTIVGVFQVNDGSPFAVPIPNGASFACLRIISATALGNPSIIFDMGI